jgi:serine/threonine protein kinase
VSRTTRWNQVKALFHQALDRAPDERAAFLRDACGSDEALRTEVESQLAAHDHLGAFVEGSPLRALHESAIASLARVLQRGDRLGPYEIVGPLGAGGMGEVYKARDTRLDRTVALKVLPASVNADSQFRSRFDREARAIAALNHPHICTLHDVGHHDGVDFLVMECLEGQTLADRLAKGALPLDQALRIAIEIADALAKAHRQGIVHRDLKPGNVMLTMSGAKLLDFGLAKLRPGGQPAIAGMSSPPTATTPLTGQGAIIGTLQYMAPEQLEARDADARADVWALGCVLYEMVTGTKAFEGRSQASLIAAILGAEPAPITSRQPLAPPILDHLVRKCLAKIPEERWQNAQDVASDLRWIAAQPSVVSPPPGLSAGHAVRGRIGWALAALLFGVTLATAALYGRRDRFNQRVVRLSVLLPEKTNLGREDVPVISPDGLHLTFVAAQSDGNSVLWVRSLDADAARPLPGTDGAQSPFWSPDSQSVGFFADGKLKRVGVSGGTPQALCDARNGLGGTWNEDGVIVFVPDAWSGLARVSASGGMPTPATTLDQAGHEQYHLYPHFLPDGRHFLYMALTARQAESAVYVGELGSMERRMVMHGLTSVAYDQSGRLLFGRDGVLLAQPFDLKTFALSGGPTTVAERAFLLPDLGSTAFSASRNGVVVYRNAEAFQLFQLTWTDRRGKALSSVGPSSAWGSFAAARLSMDQKTVVLARQETAPAGADLWLLDVVRGAVTRFTDDPSYDGNPVWSPDGRRILFSSDRSGPMNLYVKAYDGAAQEQLVLESSWQKRATDWSPDGRSIVYQTQTPKWELWQLSLGEKRKTFPLVQNNFNNMLGRFSPDGRWLAYQSDESGRWEIYIQSLTTPGKRIRISINGGMEPYWRRDGKELFFRDPGNRIIAVGLTGNGSSLEPGTPNVLFAADPGAGWYEVDSDGQRFLVPVPVAARAGSSMTVLLNWPAMLKN